MEIPNVSTERASQAASGNSAPVALSDADETNGRAHDVRVILLPLGKEEWYLRNRKVRAVKRKNDICEIERLERLSQRKGTRKRLKRAQRGLYAKGADSRYVKKTTEQVLAYDENKATQQLHNTGQRGHAWTPNSRTSVAGEGPQLMAAAVASIMKVVLTLSHWNYPEWKGYNGKLEGWRGGEEEEW